MGKRVAFIGLGTMGHPMAGHLVRAGHEVTVFNRTLRARRRLGRSATAAAWRARPARPRQGAEFVFCCVGNDEQLAQVVLSADGVLGGDGRRQRARRPHARSRPCSRAICTGARIARGVGFLDAPVSRRPGRRGARHADA